MFEVAQAAVNELGGAGGRAGSEIVHFGQGDRVPTADRVARDAASVDAAADDEDVVDCLL
ncbi:hypothetical protein D3C87_1672970 [compost metagenome]